MIDAKHAGFSLRVFLRLFGKMRRIKERSTHSVKFLLRCQIPAKAGEKAKETASKARFPVFLRAAVFVFAHIIFAGMKTAKFVGKGFMNA